MKIGFDAKRYFNNQTGLGNYSRWLIDSLLQNEENNYLLYQPKKVETTLANVRYPQGIMSFISSLWRSKFICSDLIKDEIDVYHGLSNELPFGIHKTNIKSVVTIHDLINLRYPENYAFMDRSIYRLKLRYAQKQAYKIIVPSSQTKKDLIHFFGTDKGKIEVIPLATRPKIESNEEKIVLAEYILCVSSFDRRKNLVNLVKAYKKLPLPKPKLILAGKSGDDLYKVKKAIAHDQMIETKLDLTNEDLANLYKHCLFCVYPSVFEGFGIPILEAFQHNKTVATSRMSSMPEVGGNAADYFDPLKVLDIKDTLERLLNAEYRESKETLIANRLKNFDSSLLSDKYIDIYNGL